MFQYWSSLWEVDSIGFDLKVRLIRSFYEVIHMGFSILQENKYWKQKIYEWWALLNLSAQVISLFCLCDVLKDRKIKFWEEFIAKIFL